jgi:hypothetical protein
MGRACFVPITPADEGLGNPANKCGVAHVICLLTIMSFPYQGVLMRMGMSTKRRIPDTKLRETETTWLRHFNATLAILGICWDATQSKITQRIYGWQN